MRTTMTVMSVCFVLLCLILIWGIVERGASLNKRDEIGYSDLFEKVRSGQLQDATIAECDLYGHLKTQPTVLFHTRIPADYEDLQRAMLVANVTFTFQEPKTSILVPLLFNLFPYVVLFMLPIPAFWTIFKKAGFPTVFSLLMLVPWSTSPFSMLSPSLNGSLYRLWNCSFHDFHCEANCLALPWLQPLIPSMECSQCMN